MFGIKTKLMRLAAGTAYRSQYASTGGKPLEALPLRKKLRLDIPTYDGSGQIVHPDIFFDRSIEKYVLAFTPYPHTNDLFENPCIAVSDDGIHFYEEKPGLNPLAPAPEKDHNDDPDISLHDGVYSLVYLETVRPDYQNVVALQSRDRLAWERRVLHHQELAGNGGDLILSPSIIWEGERCHCFFVMGNYESGHRIFATSAPTLEELDFTGASPVNMEGIPTGLLPWHLDLVPDGTDGWLMLLTLVAPDSKTGNKGGSYSLHVARSSHHASLSVRPGQTDSHGLSAPPGLADTPGLASWKVDPAPVITNCYRSSGFVKDGLLYIYFSSNFWADEWRTGLYKHCFSR